MKSKSYIYDAKDWRQARQIEDVLAGPAREEYPRAPMTNRFGGKCITCGQWIEARKGKLIKLPGGKWGVSHFFCREIT